MRLLCDDHPIGRLVLHGVRLPESARIGEEGQGMSLALSTLERFSGSRTVAIATHGGPIRAVLALLQGAALELADGQPLPEVVPVANCSIMHLSAACDADRHVRWRVVCVNDTAHIDGACAKAGTGIVQE